jgi:hypothetical protein
MVVCIDRALFTLSSGVRIETSRSGRTRGPIAAIRMNRGGSLVATLSFGTVVQLLNRANRE